MTKNAVHNRSQFVQWTCINRVKDSVWNRCLALVRIVEDFPAVSFTMTDLLESLLPLHSSFYWQFNCEHTFINISTIMYMAFDWIKVIGKKFHTSSQGQTLFELWRRSLCEFITFIVIYKPWHGKFGFWLTK